MGKRSAWRPTVRKIYLLHFHTPLSHARHYLGSADDVEQRLQEHRTGRGARLMAVVTAAGITWEVARTWEGDRKEERRLKRLGGHARLCPLCGKHSRKKGA